MAAGLGRLAVRAMLQSGGGSPIVTRLRPATSAWARSRPPTAQARRVVTAESIEEVCKEIGIPMRRPGQAEEVAAMNLWLASDEASYACGQVFMVDCGPTAAS